MANLFMPLQSFESEEDKGQVKGIHSKYSRLLEHIDDKVQITIIGRGNRSFWDEQITLPLQNKKILDPKIERPLHPSQEIIHLAVVTTKIKGEQDYLYGNTGAKLFDFVRAVIFKTLIHFPKKLDIDSSGF